MRLMSAALPESAIRTEYGAEPQDSSDAYYGFGGWGSNREAGCRSGCGKNGDAELNTAMGIAGFGAGFFSMQPYRILIVPRA